MANATRLVQIDPEQYNQLKAYCDIKGIQIEEAVREALADFIECCISSRLESIQARLHTA